MTPRALPVPAELFLTVALVVGGWGLHQANVELEAFSQERVDTGEVGPLPDGKLLRVASLGFERLVADLYWIRTVFYVGTEAAREANYPSAEALAHLITDIDPYFDSVYVLMSSVLAGLRYDIDAAIRLLEKGTRNSDYWRIHFHLGYLHFMERGDYATGARYLEQAVERGGPTYLPLLISRLHAHGGDPGTAILFLQQRLREEEHPRIRAQLRQRLQDVLIHRDVEMIERAVERYEQERGAAPGSVDTLVAEGFLAKPMVDPRGRAYRIEDGEVRSQTPYERMRVKE